MDYFILWLCSIASSVGNVFLLVGVIGLIAYFLAWARNTDEGLEGSLPSRKWAIAIAICFFIRMIVPSTPSCYMILGVGKTLQYVRSSPEAQKLPDNVLRTINDLLENVQTKTETIKNDSI